MTARRPERPGLDGRTGGQSSPGLRSGGRGGRATGVGTDHLLQTQRALPVDVPTDTYPERLRNMAHKARTTIEESGTIDLYLAT